MTFFELLDAFANFLAVRGYIKNWSKGARLGAHIALTDNGPRGVVRESFDTDSLGLSDLPGGDAAITFKSLPAERRRLGYYDNHRQDSEYLVVLFHGLGLDQDDFKAFLLETDLHCLAPTLPGFLPNDGHGVALPLETHSWIMARFVAHHAALRPNQKIVLVGFSTGADLLFGMMEEYLKERPRPHAVLLLDCNITVQTCFISGRLRQFKHGSGSAIDLARELSNTASDLQEWLDITKYLVRVLGKFEKNLPLLGQFADEVFVASAAGVPGFTAKAIELMSRAHHAKFIFSGSVIYQRLLREVATLADEHGTQFPAEWVEGTSHFGLVDADFLENEINKCLAAWH